MNLDSSQEVLLDYHISGGCSADDVQLEAIREFRGGAALAVYTAQLADLELIVGWIDSIGERLGRLLQLLEEYSMEEETLRKAQSALRHVRARFSTLQTWPWGFHEHPLFRKMQVSCPTAQSVIKALCVTVHRAADKPRMVAMDEGAAAPAAHAVVWLAQILPKAERNTPASSAPMAATSAPPTVPSHVATSGRNKRYPRKMLAAMKCGLEGQPATSAAAPMAAPAATPAPEARVNGEISQPCP
ncbi:hypothetical protein CYMTET_54673 [Cymbomonas tetramitiformis]|uniref:Uncharacterized protein n=1 Tax=Cymbomonas tetramitiformis TaxID=36881 RepID=A0AAE0BEF6_9CHLO|nr:hypothetical protein CYMTET_54673 [Cymbomonas tetramitiformis]